MSLLQTTQFNVLASVEHIELDGVVCLKNVANAIGIRIALRRLRELKMQ